MFPQGNLNRLSLHSQCLIFQIICTSRMTTTEFMGTFGTRNDQFRGILIEFLELNEDTYFFKYQDQPIARHCEQVQQIIRASNVKRAKKIKVNLTPFLYEYLQIGTGTVVFRGNILNSTTQQIRIAQQMAINKEVRHIKREKTMLVKKQSKIDESRINISEVSVVDEEEIKVKRDEEIFQIERARQISALFEEREQESQSKTEFPPSIPAQSQVQISMM